MTDCRRGQGGLWWGMATKKITGVGAVLCVSHNDPVRKALHGHSYEVIAWFEHDSPRDALVLQKMLEGALTGFDHKTMPPNLSRAEDIAEAILGLLDSCISVEVNRPLERLYARASV